MAVEVRQLVVRGTFLHGAEDGGVEPVQLANDDPATSSPGDGADGEQILAECRRLIAEALRDQREP